MPELSETTFEALNARVRRKGDLADMIVATVFINLLALAAPLMLLQVYDRILPNQPDAALVILVAASAAALFLEGVLRYLRAGVGAWMGARFEHMASCAGYGRFIEANLEDFERQGSGAHLESFNNLVSIRDFYAGHIILTLCDLPFAFLFLGAIAYLAGFLVLVPIVLIALFILAAWWAGRRLRKALAGRAVAEERRYGFIIEVLSGIHSVKGMAMEEQMLRRYEGLREISAGSEFLVARLNANAAGLGALFAQAALFLVTGFGVIYVIGGVLTIGGLAACALLAGLALQPLQRAVGFWTRFQRTRLARQQTDKIFNLKRESPRDLPDLENLDGSLELQGVSFGYGKNKDDEDPPPVFRRADLKIEPGESIGITGSNASGKTTLLYLMTGICEPADGRVLIDGKDIRKFNTSSIRKRIAYLPRDGVLFNGTILENLTMFRREKEADARDFARLLGLDEVIARLPKGYETRVGDSVSDKLPGGQIQRIAIARALVDRPRILLFDEANSAMDGKADMELRRLLERLKGRVTMVFVTPQPPFLKIADKIYEIRDAGLRLKPAGEE